MLEKTKKNKEGIALVIVLGILSLLVLISVSFLILMRTERKGAGNYVRLMQIRQLSLAAVDQVINELSDPSSVFLGTNFYARSLWSTNQFITSYALSNLFLDTPDIGGEYFVDAGVIGASPELNWSELMSIDPNMDYGCLYAYIVVDDSAKIDINHVPDDMNLMRLGYSAAEANTIRNAMALNLVHLYNNAEIAGSFDSDAMKQYFTSYNRFSQKVLNNTDTAYDADRAIIGVDPVDMDVASIIGAFSRAGITTEGDLFTNMLDYIDADDNCRWPMDDFCSEALPMINEIACEVDVDRAGGLVITNTIEVTCTVEIWNPYENVTNLNTYTLDWNIGMTNSSGITMGLSSMLTNIPGILPNQFVSLTTVYRGRTTYIPAAAPANLGDLDIALRPEIAGIDVVPSRTFSLNNISTADRTYELGSHEVDDPRVNYRPESWSFIASNTINSMNSSCSGVSQLPLFMANENIRQVGELGFISVDRINNWSPVAIIGAHSNVLDYFTVYTNKYQHGLVNINSQETNLLAAAMDNANVRFAIPSIPTLQSNAAAMSSRSLAKPYTRRSEVITEIEDQRILAACSDLFDVYGQAYTALIMVRIFKDNTAVGNSAPNGSYNGPIVDPDIGQQFLVVQFWRDPVSKEIKLNFLKWQRRS